MFHFWNLFLSRSYSVISSFFCGFLIAFFVNRLVVAMSKDLLSDFYPHFSQFFQRLVDLLQTREPQIIEWTFTTLAHLYKNLWRHLVKDIEIVYELLLPLLASGKPSHIQQFASESFSFIGRKVSNKADRKSVV